jgi:hypothetical protein
VPDTPPVALSSVKRVEGVKPAPLACTSTVPPDKVALPPTCSLSF